MSAGIPHPTHTLDPQKPPTKRRGKLRDRHIPNAILQSEEFSVDSRMYQDLLDMERKLDWTLTRKRVEVQDALGRQMSTVRTLRIFLSHTVSGQAWQTGEGTVNVETGEGVPAWQLKIEGRLLELPNQRARDRIPQRKFSTLVKQMVVELQRDPTQYPDSNTVEWARNPNQAAMDGFTIRRRGDALTRVRVIMYLDQQPEQYKVHPDLGSILGITHESRAGIIQALWNYIKLNDLQDKVDRRMIRADPQLRHIFGQDTIQFAHIPERVNRYLMKPDPIVLHYTLNPAEAPPEKPSAWDVEIRLDDSGLKSRMSHVLVNMTPESAKEIARLDEEVGINMQSLNNSHLKRTFLDAFARNPQEFIQTWLESQSRDLETALGSGQGEGPTLRQDDLRRSEFFRLPWVEEAIAVQEGIRLAQKAGLHG